MHRLEETSSSVEVTLAVIGYSLCSSTLLLANKAAMVYLNRPSVISFVQIIFAAFVILIMKYCCRIQVDDFESEKIKPYLIYIVAFVSSIYANMQALSVSNVETVIVFRSCTPLAVTVIDYLFMNRAFPSKRSAFSLLAVCFFALLYCTFDSQLALNGLSSYSWVSIYFVLITFEMTYGKKLTSAVKMKSVWGPVLYCNTLAALPMFLLGYVNGDYIGLESKIAEVPAHGMSIIIFSCVAGLLIGYTGWLCRGMISATSFTLVGVVNKFITVLLNVILWDKHSSAFGILAVCGCLVAGVFYEQAPLRSDAHKADARPIPDASVVEGEEVEKLLEVAASPRSSQAN